jgi:hypothetical protein
MSQAGEMLWAIPEAHPGGVTALISVPEKEMIVTGGEHGEVRAWNVRTRQMKAHLKLHTVRHVDDELGGIVDVGGAIILL